jgi:hypothetical protein
MLLKTKDRCGRLGNKSGISLITNEIRARCGNITDNKRVASCCVWRHMELAVLSAGAEG